MRLALGLTERVSQGAGRDAGGRVRTACRQTRKGPDSSGVPTPYAKDRGVDPTGRGILRSPLPTPLARCCAAPRRARAREDRTKRSPGRCFRPTGLAPVTSLGHFACSPTTSVRGGRQEAPRRAPCAALALSAPPPPLTSARRTAPVPACVREAHRAALGAAVRLTHPAPRPAAPRPGRMHLASTLPSPAERERQRHTARPIWHNRAPTAPAPVSMTTDTDVALPQGPPWSA